MHHFAIIALLLTALIGMPAPAGAQGQAPGAAAPAQDQQRIVALVNDEVISLRDINQRSRVIMATARLPDTPEVMRAVREQAMRSLIDERLQMQEAKRRGISVSQQELDSAIALIERQFGIPAGRFEDFAQRSGIDPAIFIAQVRAELTWARMVRARLNATVTVTDQEIDEQIAKLRSLAGQTEELISEILVPVDNPDQEEPQRQTAQRIVEQLRAGASFPAMARQFSRGTTATNGGEVGWIQRGTLPEEVEQVIAQMNKGDISDPIRSIGGYQIIALRDRRRIAMPGAGDSRVTLKQILFPLGQAPNPADVQAAIARAQETRARIDSCEAVDAVIEELKTPGSGSLGTLRLDDLPEAFRQPVSQLNVNETTQPVQTPQGIRLFTLCAREESGSFDRNQVRQSLLMRRAELLAQRYIRELRRDATIEFR
ncbi:MAG TPA: peptidylprolyl isomerase [Ferrovibrio sp.]|uniref:peptidylprolyl isomerase n=1 Tax=Ferrovibrio sp. TaxID=1917215 RepID=UPI002B4B54F8|nr:peptidylprolyl isomerase [Ferrovibrio sp.]HLT78200.1 peptidylprolyl isomerase [Ferrovibrio sp.]